MADTPNASGEPDELYLDAAATEPVTRNVIEAMMPFMTDAYANPASVHQPGKTAARALDAARASFAAGLGARPDDVIFTSGGTESDNLAIKGIAMARMRALGLQPVYGLAGIDDEPSGVNPAQAGEHPAIRRPRIIISSIEHPAVAQSAQWLHEWFGFEVVHIPVDGQAHLDLDALEQELDGEAGERTTLVSAILANNEVGTVEPVEELVRIAHAHGVPIHVDAVQAAGQIPIRMRDWDVDALSVSGHKFGTPKGLGALLVRGRTPIEPVLSGGGQERGLRSGTQNVAGAVALAIGLNESNARMAAQYRELTDSRDMLIDAVRRVVPRAELTGDPVSRLPGHVPRSHRRSSACRSGRPRHSRLVRIRLRHWPSRDSRHAACHGAGTADRQIRPAYDIPPSPHTGGNRAHLHGLGRLLHRADALVHMVSSQRSLRGQRVLLLIGGRFGCVSRRIARLMPVCV